MTQADRSLVFAARCMTTGGGLVGAAALFHFFAAPHLPVILRRVLEPSAFAFLEPIVSFTFVLNGVLLVPLCFSTLWSAAGIRRGEPWARWVGLVNALTILTLPCLLVSTMGLRYFSDAPLFAAGAGSIVAAGLLVVVPVLWTWWVCSLTV